jgi:hypothetical protein
MNPLEWGPWLYGKFFANHNPIWGYLFACIIAITIALMAWTQIKDKYEAEHQPAFLGGIDVAWVAQGREWMADICVGYNSSHGKTLSPVNIFSYMRLENLQQHPSMISEYGVEMKSTDGKWARLKRIDTRPVILYYIGGVDSPAIVEGVKAGFKNAQILDRKDGLDVQLENQKFLLQPRQPVVGWAAFEYPENTSFTIAFPMDFRMTIKDTLGVKWSEIVTVGEPNKTSNSVLWSKFTFVGQEDVSAFHRKSYSDP